MTFRALLRYLLESSIWQAATFFSESAVGRSIREVLPATVKKRIKEILHAAIDVQIHWETSHVEEWDHDRPLLSVVIPCRNYGQYIHNALSSLRAQTFQDFELIIVDKSTDPATLNIIKQLEEENIRVLRQTDNGLARARNLGISNSRGKYVCCLDADDTVEPTYFEKSLCLLEANPGVSFAYPSMRLFGDKPVTPQTQAFDLRLLLTYNHVCVAAIFKKESWLAVGGFDPSLSAYEDWDFWIKLGKSGFRGQLIPEPLFNYRQHEDSMLRQANMERRMLLAQIKSNHQDLFSNPKRINSIISGYRNYYVSIPFINLNSRNQYLVATRKFGLIITESHASSRVGLSLYEVIEHLKEKQDLDLYIVTTDQEIRDTTEKFHLSRRRIYRLPSFLDGHYWLDFVINLIETRLPQFILISGSELTYQWIPEIRAHSTASIINAVCDDSVVRWSELAARFDPFIDYHLRASERIAKSFVEDFRISKDKVKSIHYIRELLQDII